AAEADLVPGVGVRVVDAQHLPQRDVVPPALRRQIAPGVTGRVARAHATQHLVLALTAQFRKGTAEQRARGLVETVEAALPRLRIGRHIVEAEAIQLLAGT